VLDIRKLLHELRREGAAILLSSHQLNEVAMVSDRIAFLHEGRLLRFGRLDELLGSAGESDVMLRGFTPSASFRQRWSETNSPGAWRVPSGELRSFLEAAWAEGAELVSAAPAKSDLTAAFLEWSRADLNRQKDTRA
jgi:ABC-2 type transport system ATP-binding protein